MKISGKNISLHSVSLDDANVIESIRNNEELSKYLNSIQGIDQRKWLESQIAREGDFYFKCVDNSNKIVGLIGLYDLDCNAVEWGRLVFQNDSFLVFEVINLLFEFAQSLEIDYIYCRTRKENIKVCSMHSRLPYTYISDKDSTFQICVLSKSDIPNFLNFLNRFIL